MLRSFFVVYFWLFRFYFLPALPADSVQNLLGKKGVVQPSTKNDTWFLSSEPEKHYIIDSTIFGIQYYNVIQRDGIEYTNCGNQGSAAYPLVFSLNSSTGFNLGYSQFDIYRYVKDSIKYYQVIRPYTELNILIGLKNEQVFHAKFANQHKGIIYYGVDYRRFFSKGIYSNNKTNDNCFSLYGIFNSKNKHWNIQADLIFNSFVVQENGGVQINPFDSSYFQKTLVPVSRDKAENNYNQVDFYLKTSYNVGRKYFERKNDTARVQSLMPVFRISYQFNVERNKNKYRDREPDSIYYGDFMFKDSVFNDLNFLKISNALMLDFHARKLSSDSVYFDKNFIVYAETGFDYYLLNQNLLNSNTSNFYLAGSMRSNAASESKIIYKGAIKYFPYGWNQHDLLADALVGYDFGKFGILSGNATYQLKETPYVFERYTSHPKVWRYDLPKTKLFGVGGKYQNLKYGILADFNYYVVDHLPVYTGLSSPYIISGEEIAFVAHLANRNGFYGLHLDNDIWFTSTPTNGLIKKNFAMLITKHSIYYERRVFKKTLWFAVGFDLRYSYKNNYPYYEPLLGAFYPEGSVKQSYPVLDWFLNLKIRTVRVFFKVDNISSSFGPKGYFSLADYPAADVSFRAGIKWRFFE